ncbi:hypothetical protein BC833DRAFT_574486 [Globomyces pollinis-pini]|nr:hypothetical protein BC833DRAFT_574486 [Globomyces pollinis-pini]
MTKPEKKTVLLDDDEFEDFPIQVYNSTDTKLPQWQDTWEDDDNNEDFAVQLEKEQKKDDMKL